MTAPIRIQRRRAKGWKLPPNTVYVGRPTRWGNPFGHILREGHSEKQLCHIPTGLPVLAMGYFPVVTSDPEIRRHNATGTFARWITGPWPDAKAIRDKIGKLRGKNLACWCPLDGPCHATILLEMANADVPDQPTEGPLP